MLEFAFGFGAAVYVVMFMVVGFMTQIAGAGPLGLLWALFWPVTIPLTMIKMTF